MSDDGGGSGDDAEGGTTTGTLDGTTGMPCTAKADCKGANGPGINVCSNMLFNVGAFFPTAVCMTSAPCTVPTDGSLAFCDDPDPNNPPGVCVGTAGSAKGICFPICSFDDTGAAPQGCIGKDACQALGYGDDPMTGKAIGVGFCQPACTADTDCPSGQHCQTDSGLCETTLPTGNGQDRGCLRRDRKPAHLRMRGDASGTHHGLLLLGVHHRWIAVPHRIHV